MDIKYPPLINLKAELTSVKSLLGKVVIVATIKGKDAQLILDPGEAMRLVANIQVALTPK